MERLVFARQFCVGVLDVLRGNVVRKEHHLVGEELLLVHALEVPLRHAAHEVDDRIAGARTGVEDDDAGIGERESQVLLKGLDDAGAHVIDNGLRRVDDPLVSASFLA